MNESVSGRMDALGRGKGDSLRGVSAAEVGTQAGCSPHSLASLLLLMPQFPNF